MNTVRILGIGSPSGDDQAGWRVVDALQALGAGSRAGVALCKLDRPGAALLAQLEGAGHLILIDAMQGGGEPGAIRRLQPAEWPALATAVSSHGFGVANALALADALGALPAQVEVYGIEIAGAQPGAALSAAVDAAAQALARRLDRALRGARQAA